jgi:hypothetical protein
MKAVHVFMIAALALGACRKSDEAKKDTSDKPTAAAEEKKAARPAPPPVDEGIDVPTEEDFEEAATSQITEQTDLGKELDQLEKDIGK